LQDTGRHAVSIFDHPDQQIPHAEFHHALTAVGEANASTAAGKPLWRAAVGAVPSSVTDYPGDTAVLTPRHERLGKITGLAVFASDALSSVAYASEEMLLVLMTAGTAALALSLPIAAGIAVLVVIVATSYWQTIHAYPSGGGAYIVATDNLGRLPGLIAGAALLVDYVLTVAVSVAAGVAAITSAVPALFQWRVTLGILTVVGITVANLRGVRESGRIFAAPTYWFICSLVLLILGFFRVLTGTVSLFRRRA
jgi:amino acid transporter